jgi:23S rRNA pseudouridine2605 synthase
VKEPGSRVDPERDHVTVEGRAIPRHVEHLYVALYKPRGYVTTREDPHASHIVMDLVRAPLEAKLGRNNPAIAGLHPVGRLDTQTEGLLLLTNDGAFTQALTHPRHQVPKLYVADVTGIPSEEALQRIRTGIPLFGQRTLPAKVRVAHFDRTKGVTSVEVELREGRNQQVRRMFQAVGYPVYHLRRIAVGPVTLGRMRLGHWRFLTPAEVQTLLKLASAPPEEGATMPRPRARGRVRLDGTPPRRPAAPRPAEDAPSAGTRSAAAPSEETPPHGPGAARGRSAGRPDAGRADARPSRPSGPAPRGPRPPQEPARGRPPQAPRPPRAPGRRDRHS